MGRSVDGLTRDRRAVLGRATARGVTLAGLLAARAAAGDGDVPELTPPSEMPIVSKPTTPTTTPAPARPTPAGAPRNRAVLAIPGLTTPTARPSAPLEAPSTPVESSPGGLMLDAPVEMKPVPNALPALPADVSPRSARPLILESSSMDELPPPGAGTTRVNPPSRKPATPPQAVQAPSRRPRLFGFLGAPAATPAPAPSSNPPATRSPLPGRAVVADPLREDPAAESALKRRIERQAREVVGNRARSVEVKVAGKEAVLQVSGTKFYQRRAIRKQLEGIPALSGIRSTIEVDD